MYGFREKESTGWRKVVSSKGLFPEPLAGGLHLQGHSLLHRS
jgi:hypothetical protein